MNPSPVYRPHLEERAAAHLVRLEPSAAWNGLSAHGFEIVSRGDFVCGDLYLPPKSDTRPAPLVLVQHGARGSRKSPYLECAARWARDGFAVAAIDLPLHGDRASPKLSERLIDSIDRITRDEALDLESGVLVEEFARQSTSDLIRTIDALTTLDAVDAGRVGFVGFSLGGVVGSYLLAHDARVRVAVLALAGGGHAPSELDPATHLATAPSRPLLFVATEDDERVPARSSRALFDAAVEPKTFLSVPGDHGGLPGTALARIQSFLKGELESA